MEAIFKIEIEKHLNYMSKCTNLHSCAYVLLMWFANCYRLSTVNIRSAAIPINNKYTKISNRFLQCEPTQVAFVHFQNAAHFEIEMFAFSSESGLKMQNAKR